MFFLGGKIDSCQEYMTLRKWETSNLCTFLPSLGSKVFSLQSWTPSALFQRHLLPHNWQKTLPGWNNRVPQPNSWVMEGLAGGVGGSGGRDWMLRGKLFGTTESWTAARWIYQGKISTWRCTLFSKSLIPPVGAWQHPRLTRTAAWRGLLAQWELHIWALWISLLYSISSGKS